jgi:hypothetical protein
MSRRSLSWSWLWVPLATACGAAQLRPLHVQPTSLEGSDGARHRFPAADGSSLTVLVFFSVDCDCQAAHDARLLELYRRYHGRGVAFFAVDSEVQAAVERDATEARRRAYPYPILIDHGALLARALEAEYATYTVVLDNHGAVRYRGGIDSDQKDLHRDARFYLRDALDDLLARREPRRAHGEALGCALQTD